MMPSGITSDLPVPRFADPERRERLVQACSEIEPIFRRRAEERHYPGIAYGVLLDGELIFEQAFGVANVATGVVVDGDTVFRIASMTKSFAALAILQLRDAGKLRLDDPIAHYVPEFIALEYPGADSPQLTVRHLLTMSAGWPEDDPWGDRQIYRSDSAMSEIYSGGVSWSNPPGITFEYSNLGYMVLGRIVTNVAGMPAIQYINEHVLKPLNMAATVWNATDVPPQRLALGYRWEDGVWKEEPLLPAGGDVAAFAGIFTSIHDLVRWVALFQSAWPPRSEPDTGLLRRGSLREMQQRWCPVAPSAAVPYLGAAPQLHAGAYGYGLFMTHNGQWESVGHGGGLPGFGSYMMWSPAHGIGVIALANLTYAGVSVACHAAMKTLIHSAALKPRRLPAAPALVSAREKIISLLDRWDDGVAETLFADNFFLDKDYAHWQQELAALHQNHGALTPQGEFKVENWLRGSWRMAGERGWCTVSIALSPTVPPRVQSLEIESTLPPSPPLQTAAEALAALIGRPTRRAMLRLTAAAADREALWAQVRLANILCGPCTVGEVIGGNGVSSTRLNFKGDKCNLIASITVDERGKVTAATLQRVD